MAVRTATTDPKPSSRHNGFDYFYYNKLTTSGSNCAAIIPPSLRGIVRKGFVFDDNALRYDDELRASILELDFDEPAASEPALPDDPDAGWGDHDHLAAGTAADPQLLNTLMHHPTIPNRGVSPATARKHAAAARAAEHNIDVELLLLLDQLCSAYNYASKRIGVVEKPRAMEAQKLLVTAAIPWLKSRGTALSEEDAKAMNF
jgi:hypothetical protein